MSHTSIEDYNAFLVQNQCQINIIEYVKKINEIKYKIDISFIDEFIELVSKNECCISHNMLQKYGISNIKGGSKDVKRILEQNEFEEKIDFELSNVAELRPQGGKSIKNEYFLHPRAFKICLMRSLKTKKYAKYYLLLEECIKYYNDYQTILKEKYIIKLKSKIIIKNEKIDTLESKIDEILLSNKELLHSNKHMENLMNKANLKLDETLEKLDETNEKLDDTKEELEETNEKLDHNDKTLNNISKKLDIAVEDRVIKTKKTSTLEYFVVMKNETTEYKYYIIRGQKRYIKLKQDKLENFTQIKILECVPNASILWNLMKESLKNKVEYFGNKLNLIKITEEYFLNKIDDVYNKRKEVVL